MKKNIDGKKLLEAFMMEMYNFYQWNNEMQLKWLNNPFEDDAIEAFDFEESIHFTRLWNVVMENLSKEHRNLYLLFMACGCDYQATLDALNGCVDVKNYKNVSTLRFIMFKIRKKIREFYKERYGVN